MTACLSTVVSRAHAALWSATPWPSAPRTAALRPSALWPAVQSRIDISRRVLFLTFDDGPTRILPELLESLRRVGAGASFFFRGDRLEERPESARLALRSGHTVGLHGFAHLNAWSTGKDHLTEDLAEGFDVFVEHLGERPHFVRPPYGRLRPALAREYNTRGLKTILWDVDPIDYRTGRGAGDVCLALTRWSRPGSILLLHENTPVWSDGLELLEAWISTMKAQGWVFESIPATDS